MKDIFTKEIILPFTKKVTLFLSIWTVSYVITDSLSNSYYETVLMQALALAILIIFVWRKIDKKYFS